MKKKQKDQRKEGAEHREVELAAAVLGVHGVPLHTRKTELGGDAGAMRLTLISVAISMGALLVSELLARRIARIGEELIVAFITIKLIDAQSAVDDVIAESAAHEVIARATVQSNSTCSLVKWEWTAHVW